MKNLLNQFFYFTIITSYYLSILFGLIFSVSFFIYIIEILVIGQKTMNRLELLSQQISSSTDKYSFKGKTIVVTGGSRGIGLAIAKKCAKDGANVAILAKTT